MSALAIAILALVVLAGASNIADAIRTKPHPTPEAPPLKLSDSLPDILGPSYGCAPRWSFADVTERAARTYGEAANDRERYDGHFPAPQKDGGATLIRRHAHSLAELSSLVRRAERLVNPSEYVPQLEMTDERSIVQGRLRAEQERDAILKALAAGWQPPEEPKP